MAEELDPSMLPNWLRDMDDGPSVRPGADDCARYGLTWCGSFTVYGLGFQAMNGTTTDFAMAWPIGRAPGRYCRTPTTSMTRSPGRTAISRPTTQRHHARERVPFPQLIYRLRGRGVAREPYTRRRRQVVQGALLGPPDLYRWAVGIVQARLLCRRV